MSYANPQAAEPLRIFRDEPDTTKQPKMEVFSGKDVAPKARVLVKPEPMYTETARQAQTTGTVVLRGIFTSTGHVTNLRVVRGVPNGLRASNRGREKHQVYPGDERRAPRIDLHSTRVQLQSLLTEILSLTIV